MIRSRLFLCLTTLFCYFQSVFPIQSWEVNEHHHVEGTRFGDMVLTPPQLNRYVRNGTNPIRGVSRKETSFNRWENNTVPYMISPQYTNGQKELLRRTLEAMEKLSCFQFKERTNERDYIVIVPLDGCYSYVGKIGGRQLMSLSDDCLADYIIWHEMMHAIGFEHEHQRPDRDRFLRVEYKNVLPGQMSNFEKIDAHEVDFPDVYDYKSIMHYDGYAFGKMHPVKKMRMVTMVPLKKGVELGDNIGFSPTDLAKLNRLGNCRQRKESSVVQSSCRDRAFDCAYFIDKGMCNNGMYKKLMAENCAQSCRMCAQSEQRKPVVEECEDTRQSCDLFSSQCSNPAYSEMMKLHCRRTCGLCTQKIDFCVDLDEKCTDYAQKGYCINEFYIADVEIRCRKTCGVC